MEISNYISNDYQVVHPHTGVNLIEETLINNNFLVVQDELKQFYGIITPADLIKRPHKIVIDCLDNIEKVYENETLIEVYNKMITTNRDVLPVFKNDSLCGVIKMVNLISNIGNKKVLTGRSINQVTIDSSIEMKIADKIKNKFLENISHEIRTPLNGIVGFAEIIASMTDEQPPSTELLNTIIESSKQFLNVVNAIVEMSKIQTGDIVFEESYECSAKSIIEETYNYFATDNCVLNKNNITITKEHPNNDISFTSDKMKVKQILSYIVSNALKFTEKGSVKIGYLNRNSDVVFYVQDTGPGIPKEKQDYIFIPFEKIETNRNKILPGVGLGLTIAKHYTNSLGGEIWFNTVENEGTMFCIQLPLELSN
ncbi:MAG: hypothetical protein JW717_07865 [Marinilabiliaceae bacterium]|nr:hypothetical protein [Marinilabiliaceae bacterium]